MSAKDKDLVDMMNGAVPRTDIKWGHFATGLVIGSMIGNEAASLVDELAARRAAQQARHLQELSSDYDWDQW